MTQEITINTIKGTGKNFSVEYTEDNRQYFAVIPLKTVSKFLKDSGMYVIEGIEIIIVNLKSEIIIISLN